MRSCLELLHIRGVFHSSRTWRCSSSVPSLAALPRPLCLSQPLPHPLCASCLLSAQPLFACVSVTFPPPPSVFLPEALSVCPPPRRHGSLQVLRAPRPPLPRWLDTPQPLPHCFQTGAVGRPIGTLLAGSLSSARALCTGDFHMGAHEGDFPEPPQPP